MELEGQHPHLHKFTVIQSPNRSPSDTSEIDSPTSAEKFKKKELKPEVEG